MLFLFAWFYFIRSTHWVHMLGLLYVFAIKTKSVAIAASAAAVAAAAGQTAIGSDRKSEMANINEDVKHGKNKCFATFTTCTMKKSA